MSNKNYPHPVLNSKTNDYDLSKAHFLVKATKVVKGMHYEIAYDATLQESNLEKLFKQKKVLLVFKVECSATRYKEIFRLSSLKDRITILSTNLEKKVSISTFIVAAEFIDAFSSDSFNEDYEDVRFSVFPGDILGEGQCFEFQVKKRIDPLVKLPSIFSIVRSEGKDTPPIDFNTMGQKIVITLDKNNFEEYKDLKRMQNDYGHLAALTASIFIFPTLVKVLDDLLGDLLGSNADTVELNDMITDKENAHRWFRVINMKLEALGIKLNEPSEITDSTLILAQKLLGNPLSKGLLFFKEAIENNGEEEEL